jgi:hypothetical protein
MLNGAAAQPAATLIQIYYSFKVPRKIASKLFALVALFAPSA